jgi:hypothetical protein
MKINRSDFVDIASGKSMRPRLERPLGNIEKDRWIEYVENHKDTLIWYEDTPQGKETMENLDKYPDRIKEELVSYRLNKAWACTIDNKLAKQQYDLMFKYSTDRKAINVHRENKITIPIAELILDMAKFLDSNVVINGSKFFESIDQLE